jgi:hypothetical protein
MEVSVAAQRVMVCARRWREIEAPSLVHLGLEAGARIWRVIYHDGAKTE